MTDYPEPGIELDKLVAEKVLGWDQDSLAGGARDWWFSRDDSNRHPGDAMHLNRFSTDIKAAWELVEKFRLCVTPFLVGEVPFRKGWTAYRQEQAYKESKRNAAPTAPHAICLASLNIVKAEPRLPTACVITYQENVLHCARYKTRKENFDTVKCALVILLGKHLEGEDFEQGGGTVEFYRSVG